MTTIRLAHATDWPGFRHAARALLQAQCPPDAVQWQVAGGADADLFSGADTDVPEAAPSAASSGTQAPSIALPRSIVTLCERIALHRDPTRWALMYRLLWRTQHEPALRHDPLDADRMHAAHMARAVARDVHKMRAFVRFRPVAQDGGEPLHVAWFEPDHHIVAANAPFFARRFTQMQWAILTPDASVRWDGAALHHGPGAAREDAPATDDGEALWLTYYRHIFNPARLNLDMMRREMPTRYWKNLPEAALIDELAQSAGERSARMVAAPASVPRRLPRSSGGALAAIGSPPER